MRLSPALLLGVTYVGGAMSMWGTLADTAWHRTLARESFWSPPHLFIYSGGFVVWTAAIVALVLATRERLVDVGGPVAHVGRLRLPFGFALTVFGVLIVVCAAPFDIWFHAVFGKDVLIWSPPHSMGQSGSMVAAAGILFATAAQHGRGVLKRRWLWMVAVALPAVHFIHVAHYILAHYVMVPATRTADFYPLLVAVMFPTVLVALARAAGPGAPLLASLLFFAATIIVDRALAASGFARYTITPVIAAPAVAIAFVYALAGRAAARVWVGALAGLAFTLAFVGIETLWMARVVGQPWPHAAVIRALPSTLLAGTLSGVIGWAWGGFLLAPRLRGGVVDVFGSPARARAAGVMAVALIALAVIWLYRPQVFGPPMAVTELALEATPEFPVQEAVFWEAVLDEDFGKVPQLTAQSEGIIDGIPLPIGPAWCAPDASQLERELAAVDFGLEINGVAVDLSPYPVIRMRLREGRACGWVGVISRHQRASRNRFVYEIVPRAGSATVRSMRVEMTVVFKDP